MWKKVIIISIVVIFLSAIGGAAYWALFTPQPADLILQKHVGPYLKSGHFRAEDLHGGLLHRIVYKNIFIDDLKNFPAGTTLKIQRLSFTVKALNVNGVRVKITNARLKLPYSDPIVLQGMFEDGILDCNVFSTGVDIKEILNLFPDVKVFKPFSGITDKIDLYVHGLWEEPHVIGSFFVDELKHQFFSLTNVPGALDLKITGLKEKDVNLSGTVSVTAGTIQSQKTPTIVNIDPGQFIFSGKIKDTHFNLRGNAKIEKTVINIYLKGTKSQPDLHLTSEDGLPQGQLLLMVATGKKWSGLTELATNPNVSGPQVSSEVAGDFIDFALFSGEGGKLAERLGIKDINFEFNGQTKGVGVKKEITDKADVGYGIESTQTTPGQSTITHKLEGEYNVTDNLSVDVKRDIKQEPRGTQVDQNATATPQNDSQILLKYKTKF